MSKNHRPATPVQSVQVGSTQETDKLYGEFGDLLEALVPTVDINPMPFFRQISTFFVKAKEHARTLERQRDEARRELALAQPNGNYEYLRQKLFKEQEINSKWSKDYRPLDRFRREVMAALNVEHPNGYPEPTLQLVLSSIHSLLALQSAQEKKS